MYSMNDVIDRDAKCSVITFIAIMCSDGDVMLSYVMKSDVMFNDVMYKDFMYSDVM